MKDIMRIQTPKFINYLPSKIKLAAIIILILGILFLGSNYGKKPQTASYQTSEVVKESIIESITESGNVTSDSQTNIGSPTNGIISEVFVKNGEEVSADEPLFSVRSTATPQEQAAAYASFLSAQSSLNSATAKLNSLQSALFKANQAFINDKGIQNPSEEQKADPKYVEENADWLQAEADYKNQQGVIAASRASYNSAALSYAATQDSTVTAPISGTVANLSLGTGSNVTATGTTYNNSSSSSNSSSQGTQVVVIGNFSQLSIKAPINEVDISKVKVGQKATVTLDAFPEQTFVGRVTSTDTIGVNSSGVVTFNAYISLVLPPASIKPGMSATAIIQIARHDNALSIPTAAIQTTNGTSTVQRLKSGKVEVTEVETGISSDTNTEILSGLSEGDSVIIGAQSTTIQSGASPFSGINRGFGGLGGGGNARVLNGARVGR